VLEQQHSRVPGEGGIEGRKVVQGLEIHGSDSVAKSR
jgi:hypothetical protein